MYYCMLLVCILYDLYAQYDHTIHLVSVPYTYIDLIARVTCIYTMILNLIEAFQLLCT